MTTECLIHQVGVFNRCFKGSAKAEIKDNRLDITIGKMTMVIPLDGKPKSLTACPFCYAKNPKGPHSFLAYDPDRPGIVICEVHGEMPITEELLNGPKFYFSHYEEP